MSFLDGKPDGSFVVWYDSGAKMGEGTFQNGKPDGIATKWHENGDKEGERTFENGELHGRRTEWNENGQKTMEASYNQGRLLSIKSWKPNGETCPLTRFENGYGLAVKWHDEKQKASEVKFQKGKEHGMGHSWYKNGNKRTSIKWELGLIEEVSVWKPDGSICPESKVVDGKGLVVKYKEDGLEEERTEIEEGEEKDFLKKLSSMEFSYDAYNKYGKWF